MTVREWADEVLLRDVTFNKCYIAVMDVGGTHDLEVEISAGEIGGTYFDAGNEDEAKKKASELAEYLASKGKKVYLTYRLWDESCW